MHLGTWAGWPMEDAQQTPQGVPGPGLRPGRVGEARVIPRIRVHQDGWLAAALPAVATATVGKEADAQRHGRPKRQVFQFMPDAPTPNKLTPMPSI